MTEKFKLLKDLGGGAFGRTYKVEIVDEALREKWGSIAVIKVPHNKSKEKVLIEELIRYEILFQNLDAQHIVKYLGFDIFRDQYVMVMEYFEGGDLYQAIKQRSRLTIAETIEISEQISKGLLEAHKARILHRDIKPSNVLVDARLTLAKITDLGVSALLREGEAAHTMTGTLPYMAPEIVRGEGGFYSDIYSLCVTMYEMVTGDLPIKGSSIEQLVHNIQTLTPIPPANLRPDIPPDLNELMVKGLEKDISKRFKTIEEMLIAIQRLKSPQDFSKDIEKAWKVFRSGDIVESKNLFREILKKYPHQVESYLNVSEFYNRCEDYDLSIRVLKKGLEYHPGNAILHWNLAMVYSQKKMGREASTMLERALELGLTGKMQSQGKLLVELWKKSG